MIKLKKILKYANIVILTIIILLSSCLIGTPLVENNVQLIYIIAGIFSIAYFVYQIVKKKKIEINKIDIIVIMLAFSTFIPLISQKFVSLTETIHGIIKYFCILNLYLITKNECKKNPEFIDIILNSIIISILFLCIVGIDEICFNWLGGFKTFLNYSNVEYDEVRIGSLFSYANTMAAVAGLGIFLCAGYVLKSKKIVNKIIYSAFVLVMLVTLILTYSRLVYIIFALMVLFYIIIIYRNYGKSIWKIMKRPKNIIIGSIALIALVVYIIIGLKIPTELNVKTSYQKIFYSVEPNTEYIFKFDVDSNSTQDDNFSIKVTEKNKYFDNVNETQISFSTFSGEKELKIKTQESTSVIYLKIENVNGDENNKLIIKNAQLNEKKLILKYKILPTKIIEKIQSISFNNKSVWERTEFISGALRIVKENWLFGLGTNAWRTVQSQKQAYYCYAKEVHCFPVQIFLENGIIGFIACIGIIVLLIAKLVEKSKGGNGNFVICSSIVGILFLLLHSMLDFDMSFFYVLVIVFSIIATISSEEEKVKLNMGSILYCILIVIATCSVYVSAIEYHYKKNTQMLVINAKWTEERIYNTYYKLLPFNKQIKQERYIRLSNAGKLTSLEKKKAKKNMIVTEKYTSNNLVLENVREFIRLSLECKQNVSKDIKFALKYVQSTEEFSRFQPDFQLYRFDNLKQIVKLLNDAGENEYAEKFQEQYKKEIENKKDSILDYNKARYSKEWVERYENELEKLNENN